MSISNLSAVSLPETTAFQNLSAYTVYNNLSGNYVELQSTFDIPTLSAFVIKHDVYLPSLLIQHNDINYRVANGKWIFKSENDAVAEAFKDLVASITGYPKECQEAPHFVRYTEGGKYDPHWDYFSTNSPSYSANIARGGNRVFSVLMYLNEGFNGGQTTFPRINYTVTPTTGKIIAWKNMTGDTNSKVINPESFHAGNPVLSGGTVDTKYILISWVREHPFN